MKNIAISMLLLSAATAFAGNRADAVPLQPQVSLQSERTRADVTADYIRARSEGALVITNDAAPLRTQPVTQGAGRDRDTVKAEAVQAARAYVLYDL